MAQTVVVNGVPVLVEDVTQNSVTGDAQIVKVGYGADGQFYYVSEAEDNTPGQESGALPVKVTQPLPAGSNIIGAVNVASLPNGLATQATLASILTALASLATEASLATRASEATLATRLSQADFDTKLATLQTAIDALNTLSGNVNEGMASLDPSLPATTQQVLKRIMGTLLGTLPVSIAGGANVTQGAITDAANMNGGEGTANSHLRGIDAILASITDLSDLPNAFMRVELQNLLAPTQDGMAAHGISGYVVITTSDPQNPFALAPVKKIDPIRLNNTTPTAIIPAVNTKRFRLLKIRVQTEGVVDVTFSTTADAFIHKIIGAGAGGGGGEAYTDHGFRDTSTVNQALMATLSANVGAVISGQYIEIP